MHITINTFGSRGDVQPYIALGIGLQQAGHHIQILTHRIFENFVRQHGLDFYPLDIDPRQVLINQSAAELGNSPIRMLRWMREHFKIGLDEIFRATDNAAQGADLLLNSSLSFAGFHVAEKHDTPTLATYLQPVTPTTAFHSMSTAPPPDWLPLKRFYNFASGKIINQTFFNLLLPLVNNCRAAILDLPPLSARLYWRMDTGPTPILYGFSETIVPKPPDWGEHLSLAGYWFLEADQSWVPPADLVKFLDSGPPPLYVGFGSMVDHEAEAVTGLVTKALEKTGQRAVLQSGWSGLGAMDLPETILPIGAAPHDWLFPRMAAVIHHGGAGTSASGFRAGKPTIIVSFFADQPFWGWRVKELGIGPRHLVRKSVTSDKLAEAINAATTDPEIARRAAIVGEQIRAEDGIRNATDYVEAYIKNPAPLYP